MLIRFPIQIVLTLVSNVYWIVGSLVLGAIAAVSGALSPNSAVPYRCARWWGGSIVRSGAVRIRKEGGEPLTADDRYVFFANHQSLYDVPVLLATLPVDARFLAKKSLFALPIFGFAMRKAGFVPVDRGAGAGAAKAAFRAASEQLAKGRSVLVFPEETRSADGTVLPFKSGGLLIALRAGVKIVPVGIEGTRELRPKGSVLVKPGTVTVRYGAPFDPTSTGVRGKREALDFLRGEVARLAHAQLSDERVADESRK